MSKVAAEREWLDARPALPEAEKSLRRARDRVREQRRNLYCPMGRARRRDGYA